MDLAYTPEERSFRDEIRRFLADRLPKDLSRTVMEGKRLEREDHLRWQRILHERGWVAPHWPVEWGGTGWNATERYIFEEEVAAAGAPPLIPFGITMCGPVIIRFGSAAQKTYHLPRILSGEHVWCQGFSEPEAGSDLASLRTRAVRDGDHYVVTGQKIWTTMAHWADWIFCLVRTDPKAKKQEGISFLLIDLKTPGITVRPIITLDGAHDVNEVFFDEVRVPVENRVGDENQGWTCAKFLLGYERTSIARIGASKRELRRLKAIAAAEENNGRSLIADPRWRDRIAALEIDLMALEMTSLRMIARLHDGHTPGPEASILKIRGSEIQQRLTALMMEAAGPYALPFRREALAAQWNGEPVGAAHAAPLAAQYLINRKLSIYGGSNEIQKTILAKTMLGL
jgi:alkylation response protein AidB-like acyl-CoA dehydrogenase